MSGPVYYRCTGNTQGETVACDFAAPTLDEAIDHFEQTDHDVAASCGCVVCPQCQRDGHNLPDCGFNLAVDHGAYAETCALGYNNNAYDPDGDDYGARIYDYDLNGSPGGDNR